MVKRKNAGGRRSNPTYLKKKKGNESSLRKKGEDTGGQPLQPRRPLRMMVEVKQKYIMSQKEKNRKNIFFF